MAYDEPVRYKLAQLVGNLSLLSMGGSQGIPVGHITAYNASPSLQLSFVQSMLEGIQEGDFTSYVDVIEEQAAWVALRYNAFEQEDGEGSGFGARRSSMSVGGDVALEYEDEDEGEVEEYEDEDEA
jgi:hypothetical protein